MNLKLTSKRLFYVLIATLALLSAAGIGGVVLGNQQLKQQSDELVRLKTESTTIDKQQVQLAQAKKDVVKYAELKSAVKAIVPQEKDQARTVREIVKLAEESKIRIASFSFPSSSLGQTAPKSPSASSGSSTASPTPAQPKAATPATTQVKAVEGISGVYQMEITVQTDGTPVPYNDLLTFLQKLEKNRRTAHVTSLTVQPDQQNRNRVTFNLILNVYIKS